MSVANQLPHGYTLTDLPAPFAALMGGSPMTDRGEPIVEHHQEYEDGFIPGTDGWSAVATDTIWHWLGVEWVGKLVTFLLVITIMGGSQAAVWTFALIADTTPILTKF